MIYGIIEQIQVGRTVILCSKNEYNAYKKIKRQIKDNDLNQSIKKELVCYFFKCFYCWIFY